VENYYSADEASSSTCRLKLSSVQDRLRHLATTYRGALARLRDDAMKVQYP